MKRLRRFLEAWRTARRLQQIQFLPAQTWDMNTHGVALTSFLISNTGKTYQATLDRERAKFFVLAAVSAPAGGRDYAAGFAAGFNHFVAVQDHLSVKLPPQEEQPNDLPVGDGEFVDRMSP